MDRNEAAGWFHQFVAAVYFLPILGRDNSGRNSRQISDDLLIDLLVT
jgi:hypothetical protein